MTHSESRQRKSAIRALIPRVALVFLLATALMGARFVVGT